MTSQVGHIVENTSKVCSLVSSGLLDDRFTFEESTPAIGREYVGVDIVQQILNAEDSDDLVRDLAITSKHLR